MVASTGRAPTPGLVPVVVVEGAADAVAGVNITSAQAIEVAASGRSRRVC
jgi:hypothetical protein